MRYHRLTRIFVHIFYTVMLSGCGATLLSYNPESNPNVINAMQSIREKILSQPEGMSPAELYVAENFIQINGEFEGEKSPGLESAFAIIPFKFIDELTLHHKNEWFFVTLIKNDDGNHRELFSYHSYNENDAKKFMDSINTMVQHKSDPDKPIVLNNQPILIRPSRFTKADLNYLD
ncbi:MAG: hypothetical protein ABL903_02605 [Methylococcales bacterium]